MVLRMSLWDVTADIVKRLLNHKSFHKLKAEGGGEPKRITYRLRLQRLSSSFVRRLERFFQTQGDLLRHFQSFRESSLDCKASSRKSAGYWKEPRSNWAEVLSPFTFVVVQFLSHPAHYPGRKLVSASRTSHYSQGAPV